MLPSLLAMVTLLPGPAYLGIMVVPYLAWLLARQRPLRVVPVAAFVVATGIVLARVYPGYDGMLTALDRLPEPWSSGRPGRRGRCTPRAHAPGEHPGVCAATFRRIAAQRTTRPRDSRTPMANPVFNRSPIFSAKAAARAAAAPPVPTAGQLETSTRPVGDADEMDRMTYEDTSSRRSSSSRSCSSAPPSAGARPAPARHRSAPRSSASCSRSSTPSSSEPSPPLILAYAASRASSSAASRALRAAVRRRSCQAVLATLGVVGVTLALFASGKIRASKRATKIFLIAMVGYARLLAGELRPHALRRD